MRLRSLRKLSGKLLTKGYRYLGVLEDFLLGAREYYISFSINWIGLRPASLAIFAFKEPSLGGAPALTSRFCCL